MRNTTAASKAVIDLEGRGGSIRVASSDGDETRFGADLLATVAHEFRTALTPLKGFVQALAESTVEDTPEIRREAYESMLRQAERLEQLSEDLLDLTALHTGRLRVDPREVDLSMLVRNQVTEMSRGAPGRPLTVHGPDVPVLVWADPLRVEQVIGNLLSNADRYSPQGAPVDVSVGSDDLWAVVSVRDRGSGIPDPDRDRLFDPYSTARGADGVGGSGLGLSIARGLVDAMSGRMWVVSQPDHGSTFSFSLPLATGRSHRMRQKPR